MTDMHSTGGSVWPFSQFRTVQGLTPNRSAACFWVSLSSSRRFLTCSPKVRGSKSVSFGFNALSMRGAHCKRATRPCPCGYLGHFNGRCRCTPDQVARYRGKISGPLLDRIDIQLEVPAVPQEDLLRQSTGEGSDRVRERVAAAHRVQVQRQGKNNSRLGTREIDRWCRLQPGAEDLLRQAISRLNLSARAYHRVLKLARTVADLAGSEAIAVAHVAEAIQYRKLDRMA
jgi:predicted ATPase with chaperone activity